MNQLCFIILGIIIFIGLILILLRFTSLFHFRFERGHYIDIYPKNKSLLLQEIPDLRSDHTLYFFQTYKNKSRIPNEIYENISIFAPEYKHVILDDKEGITFLKHYFKPIVLQTFERLNMGAHKADLLRYALLYIYGGVYMDIHKELKVPLSTFIRNRNIIYSIFATSRDHISQGFISSPPRHPLFLSLIFFIVHQGNPWFYHDFCKDFLYQIEKDTQCPLEYGLISSPTQNYYLFNETCSTTNASLCGGYFDRYGLCSMIYDKDRSIIYGRRHTYPW
jgi:hypothetical protein